MSEYASDDWASEYDGPWSHDVDPAASGSAHGAAWETTSAREDREAAEQRMADGWAKSLHDSLPDCPGCDLKLTDSGNHEDGSPRCRQIAGLPDQLDKAEKWLAKAEAKLRGPNKARPQRRPQGSRSGAVRSQQGPKPPPFKRFGVW